MDIEEHYDKIYRFCYYKLQSKELAEDLTQETFLRFLDSEYREQGMCIRYLYTIARNLCIEAYRKNKWDELSDDISDEGTEADKLECLLRSPRCPFVLYVGKRNLVKRKKFEKFISDNIDI